MASVELTHLLSKVESIKKQLGGPVDDIGSKESDEFNAVKLRLAESINEVSKKQQERDDNFAKNGRTVGVIRNEVEIQDLFTELDLQLAQMKEVLRRQKKNPKKYPAATIEIKEQQYHKYSDLVRNIRGREDGETIDTLDKPITLTELKINLTGDKSKKAARIDVGRELNEIEEDALKRFKKNDEEMDKMLGDINQGLDGLRQKAEVMGDAIEGQKDQIHGMEIEINKAHEGLVTSNARLKKVLYQYRKPSKFCLDVILVLLLLGLIAVIIKLATSGI